MEPSKNIDERIGEAWKVHYQGQEDLAIQQFNDLVQEVPDNIDAYWGLGLSYRDAGDLASAAQVFQKAKDMIAAQLASEEIKNHERYLMLARMVDQQLTQMDAFVAQSSQTESSD